MAARKNGKSRNGSASNNEWYPEHIEATSQIILDMIGNADQRFVKGWDNEGRGGLPYNGLTGEPYRGFNSLGLMAVQHERGFVDSRWFTFKQGCVDLGYKLRKGEKHTKGIKYKSVMPRDRGEEGKRDEDRDDRAILIPLPFQVFNAEQFEGMPPPPQRILRPEHERHAQCEQLMEDSGAEIRWGGDQAFYHPARDIIQLPERHQFHDAAALYATAMHELAHWTGGPSRLNRDMSGRFGTPDYAREELNAEIASLFIGERLGIAARPANHASYLKSWHKLVQDDPKAILKACSMAEKICEFLGVERYVHEATQKAEKTAEQTQAPALKSEKAATASNDDAPAPAEAKRVAQRRASYGLSM